MCWDDRHVQHACPWLTAESPKLQHDLVAVDLGTLELEAGGVEGENRGGLEGEDDVVRRERLAVLPGDVGAGDDGARLRVVVVPLEALGEPWRGTAGRPVAGPGSRTRPWRCCPAAESPTNGLFGARRAVRLRDGEGRGSGAVAVAGSTASRASGERRDAEDGDRAGGDQGFVSFIASPWARVLVRRRGRGSPPAAALLTVESKQVGR